MHKVDDLSNPFIGTVVGIAIGRAIAGRYDHREVKRLERERLASARAPVVVLWRTSF